MKSLPSVWAGDRKWEHHRQAGPGDFQVAKQPACKSQIVILQGTWLSEMAVFSHGIDFAFVSWVYYFKCWFGGM